MSSIGTQYIEMIQPVLDMVEVNDKALSLMEDLTSPSGSYTPTKEQVYDLIKSQRAIIDNLTKLIRAQASDIVDVLDVATKDDPKLGFDKN